MEPPAPRSLRRTPDRPRHRRSETVGPRAVETHTPSVGDELMPAKKPEPEITGPSLEPKPPVVTTSTVAAPVIRTGTQTIGAGWIVQGIGLWHIANLTDQQSVWLTAGLTVLLSFA